MCLCWLVGWLKRSHCDNWRIRNKWACTSDILWGVPLIASNWMGDSAKRSTCICYHSNRKMATSSSLPLKENVVESGFPVTRPRDKELVVC